VVRDEITPRIVGHGATIISQEIALAIVGSTVEWAGGDGGEDIKDIQIF
jgi:hypothetical protein